MSSSSSIIESSTGRETLDEREENDDDEDERVVFDGYGADRQDNLRNEHGAVPVPRNFFRDEFRSDVFGGVIREERRWEQFFWTKETVAQLIKGLEYQFVQKTCCLTTPSLAHGLHVEGREETLLDIDTRFSYLPGFTYYDITQPEPIERAEGEEIRIIVLDPPFFLIPVEVIRRAVDVITGGDFSTKIIIAWLLRAEKSLRVAFEPYNLVPTTFELQYASIKPNKWKNFRLYSNVDLPGIKRVKE